MMRKVSLILLFILVTLYARAQKLDTWFAFLDKKNDLIGFKDKTGKVQIPPRFNNYTSAARFDKIMGVAEEKNGTIKSYYLTKSRKSCRQRRSLYLR